MPVPCSQPVALCVFLLSVGSMHVTELNSPLSLCARAGLGAFYAR